MLSFARLPDFADGASFWQSATRTSPGLGRAWSGLAALEYHEGNYAAAEAAIRQAMSMGRDGAGEHLLLGFALGKRGQLAAAEAELRAAIDADPQRPEPWENLAILQQAQGRPQEARASKRRAKALQR